MELQSAKRLCFGINYGKIAFNEHCGMTQGINDTANHDDYKTNHWIACFVSMRFVLFVFARLTLHHWRWCAMFGFYIVSTIKRHSMLIIDFQFTLTLRAKVQFVGNRFFNASHCSIRIICNFGRYYRHLPHLIFIWMSDSLWVFSPVLLSQDHAIDCNLLLQTIRMTHSSHLR